ncbi:MAG: hypothetical protein AAGJ18_07800 [Bacteroidota bacterium]
MNFDELADSWKSADEGLRQNVVIDQSQINKKAMQKIRSNLSETKWEALFELVVNIPFFYFLKDFCWNYMTTPRFIIPGLLLLIICTGTILFCGYKLLLIRRISPKFPIVQAQRNVLLLQYLNRREINALFFLIPTFSLSFLIVFSQGMFYVDLYAIFGWTMFPYFGGSVVVGAIIVFLMKIFPDRKLRRAIAALEELQDI